MSLQCPRCHAPKIASFHHAMKAGAAIGAVGGLARGVSAALAGGKAGAALRVCRILCNRGWGYCCGSRSS